MPKLVWILLDGLAASPGKVHLCYAQALCEVGAAQTFQISSALPPLSRPVYATYLSGLNPLEHGILSNGAAATLLQPNIFSIASGRGLRCAAAAYYWFFELCMGTSFQPKFRYWNDTLSPIQHGIFYWNDEYPAQELFADGEWLMTNYSPDFMLIHPMLLDYVGHAQGSHSRAYIHALQQIDELLGLYCPKWLARGYALVITGDHGMDEAGCHYVDSPEARQTLWWFVGNGWELHRNPAQKDLALLMLKYLCCA